MRVCSRPGCPNLTDRGKCQACESAARKVSDDRRGSAASRGYGASWRAFREAFMVRLVEAAIEPVCGAALPDGPKTQDSACRQAGLLVFSSMDGTELHFDHEPPLEDWERSDPVKVCDPMRIQLLCLECHSKRTATHV